MTFDPDVAFRLAVDLNDLQYRLGLALAQASGVLTPIQQAVLVRMRAELTTMQRELATVERRERTSFPGAR